MKTAADLREFVAGKSDKYYGINEFPIKNADKQGETGRELLEAIVNLDRAMFSVVLGPNGDFVIHRDRVHHVFEGTPDARQAAPSEAVPSSVFRPKYRALSVPEKELHDDIKRTADELMDLFNKVPNQGRYAALGRTALEEAVMWTVKELTK